MKCVRQTPDSHPGLVRQLFGGQPCTSLLGFLAISTIS